MREIKPRIENGRIVFAVDLDGLSAEIEEFYLPIGELLALIDAERLKATAKAEAETFRPLETILAAAKIRVLQEKGWRVESIALKLGVPLDLLRGFFRERQAFSRQLEAERGDEIERTAARLRRDSAFFERVR